MRRLRFMAASLLGFIDLTAAASAGPLDSPGAQKSLVCSACHGFAGNTPGQYMPVLAGMNANYFKKAIKDYAEGKRPSPEMEPYAKYILQFGLDEIADYFASQKKACASQPKGRGQGTQPRRHARRPVQRLPRRQRRRRQRTRRPGPARTTQGFSQTQMALFAGDKRKLEIAEMEEAKKRSFKGSHRGRPRRPGDVLRDA